MQESVQTQNPQGTQLEDQNMNEADDFEYDG